MSELVTSTGCLDEANDWAAELNRILESYFGSMSEQMEYASQWEYAAGLGVDMVKSQFQGDSPVLVHSDGFDRLVVGYTIVKGWHVVTD
jgi:hypothetical protein